MRCRYTWLDLVQLDAGSLPLIHTSYGDRYNLAVADVAGLPDALRDSLQAEGFDLKRGIVVSRDTSSHDGLVFKQ